MEYNLHFVHLTSFEVIKIELLDFPSNNSILDMRVADYNKSSQVALQIYYKMLILALSSQ